MKGKKEIKKGLIVLGIIKKIVLVVFFFLE